MSKYRGGIPAMALQTTHIDDEDELMSKSRPCAADEIL
jgi:hypothetical protein